MLWGNFGRRYSSAAVSQASMKRFLPHLPNIKVRSSVLLRERVILCVGGGVERGAVILQVKFLLS